MKYIFTVCIYIAEAITVLFRTSEVDEFPGFEMYAICYKPEERDLPGILLQ